MTKLEIINLVKFNIGRKDVDNMLSLWLNSAIDILNNEEINFPETIQIEKDFQLKKDVYTYNLPEDYRNICYIRIDKPFTYKTALIFFNIFDKNIKQEPSIYSIVNKNLLVSAIPNKDYDAKITYYSKIPYLVNDNDNFILNNGNILVELTTLQALQSLDNGSEYHNTLIKNWSIRYSVSLKKIQTNVEKFKLNWKGGMPTMIVPPEYWKNPFVGIN